MSYKPTINQNRIQSGKTGILKNTGKLVFFKSINLYLLLCISLNTSFVIVQLLGQFNKPGIIFKCIYLAVLGYRALFFGAIPVAEDEVKGLDMAKLPGEKGTGLKNAGSGVAYLIGSFATDAAVGKGTLLLSKYPLATKANHYY